MSGGALRADVTLRRSDSFELSVHVEIPHGSTAALLGPNGAGKSTVVAAIAGLIPIDDGLIALGDRVLDDPSTDRFVAAAHRRIGVVFQNYLLFPHLTCLDNVAFGLTSRGVPRHEARRKAQDWLERLDLTGIEHRRPSDLSGGQAQRVALARALATEPDLLLLDEPLAALDVTTRAELRHTLAMHLRSFEGPRLLITHDPTEAFLLADRVLVIEQGRITQAGTADDIRLRPQTRYAADLAGSNLLTGLAKNGVVDTGGHELHIADHELLGRVLATIRPTAISIHMHRPDGSPRNTWATTIERLEHYGERVRLRTGAPLPLTVEVTDSATREMHLAPGVAIWLALKATEIDVQPDYQDPAN